MLEAEQDLLRQAASAALGRVRGVGEAVPELAPVLEQLERAQALCAVVDHPMARWQLKWIEGLIAPDCHVAAECFHSARIGFIELGDLEHAALVSLELAVVSHLEGSFLAAQRLASEALPILASYKIENEALAAVNLLRQAISSNDVTAEVLSQVRDFLRRLRFAPR